ncbi:hypothetical protein AHAS_Ahas16G0057100 [Arachis hypogaea]
MCYALLKQLEETPLCATQCSLSDLKAKVAYLRESKLELENENEVLISDLSKAREKVKQSEAACIMAEGLKKKVEESYTRVFGEKLDLVDELDKSGEKYADLEETIAQETDEIVENLKAQF